jgi:hypothetical protein
MVLYPFLLSCLLGLGGGKQMANGHCPNGQIATCPKSAKSTKWNYQNIEFAGDAIGA